MKRDFKKAFTLLEIMIAMTIFTVVIVAIYSSWAAIVRGSKSGLDAAAAAQRSRVAMRTLEDALLTAQLYTENIQHYSFVADTSDAKFAWLSLTAQLPATFPGSGLFGDQTVRRVTFSIEPDADGTKQLLMTQIPLLLVTNSDVTAYPVTLARDVSLFVLEFWDMQLGDWTDELLTTNQLPKMVRVSIGIGQAPNGSSQPMEIASRIITIPSIAVPPDFQKTFGVTITVKIQFQNSSKGIALIIVMLVILVLAALAGAFAYSMKVETTLARNANSEVEMEWMGRSGIEYARWVLAQQLNCPNEPFEGLNQAWAGGLGGVCASNGPLSEIERQIQLGDGTITWKITDLERKFNINMADQSVLLQAMTIMNVDASLTPTISDAVLDWMDRDEDNHLSGAESDYYLSLDPPYVSKNGPFDDISELLLLKGIFENPEIYWGSASTNHAVSAFQARTSNRPFLDPQRPSYPVGLVDIFTTLSSGKINLNTASQTTLQMIPGIDEGIAAGIIQIRSGLDGVDGTDDDEPFHNVGELSRVPGVTGNIQSAGKYCQVRSLTFEVQIDVELNGITRSYFSIIRRGNRPNDFVVLKFYWK